MPSKYTTGNSPISRRIRNTASPTSGFAQVEHELGRMQSVPNLISRTRQLPNGKLHLPSRAQGGVSSTECILGTLSLDTVNSTDIDKLKLNSGFVSGGGDTVSVQPDNLIATIDDYVWLAVAWTATATDGVLMPGGTMGDVTFAQGATVPTDTAPTPSSPAGIAHIVLGNWLTDGDEEIPSPVWHNQGCGSIQLYFCPNGFFFGRGNTLTA